MRRALALLIVATSALAAAFVSPADAQAPGAGRYAYAYGAGSQTPKISFRQGQAPAGFTGGPIAASDGETVNVYVQDELLAADPTLNQHWADALAGLLHGPEIGEVTLIVGTLDQVRRRCGSGALGCYGNNVIFALGQDIRGVTALSVVTHEYGHHIADHRLNDPWNAVDWGTKRWATYEGVCARAQNGELVPGDEGRFYDLNPGEAFAEDYRVLNERRAGIPESAWQVVDRRFYPDQQALDLLAQDVSTPWTGSTLEAYTSTLGPRATGRGFRVSTPLDGDFRVRLVSPARARLTLRIVDLASGKVLAVDDSVSRVKTLGAPVCGQRLLQVQVKRVSGSGAFSLAVSKS